MAVNYRLSEGTPALKQINIPMDDVKAEQYYTLDELMYGDCSGTTETDSKTDSGRSDRAGYTEINKKRS